MFCCTDEGAEETGTTGVEKRKHNLDYHLTGMADLLWQ